MIADVEGKLFRIDLVTTPANGSSNIIADVTYISGAVDEWNRYPSLFQTGTLFRPTPNGYPLVTYDPAYTNENLKIAMQNAAILAIDQTVSGYKSGTEFPTTSKLGDGFYNTTEKRLYIYNGTDWLGVGSGILPSGTASEFPNPAKTGEMFFNTEDNSSYIYNGTIWLKISTNGSVPSGIINPDPLTVTVNEGSLFYNTSDHKLYVYNGTVWMPADNILPNGQIYVGNTTNIATPVAMSGDAAINNSGKLTIVNKAITDEKLDKLHIPLSGFANPTDNVSLGDGTTNNRIINVANPTDKQDAATKNYVDALFGNPTTLLTLPVGNFFIGNIANKAVAAAKNTIPLSGFGAAGANISLGDGTTNYKIINLANPTAAQDAATKNYVDTRVIDPGSITLANGNLFQGNATGKAASVAKNTIPISGFGAAAADVSFGNFKITNLAEPLDAQDGATKNYVDTKTLDPGNITLANGSLFVGNSSGKATATLKSAIPLSGFGAAGADISLGNFKITNLGTPLADYDAATKKYVDGLFSNPSSSLALPSGKIFLGNSSGTAVASSTSAIPISGFGKATGNIYLGDATTQYSISYLADPLYPQDAATKNYVDSKAAGSGSLALDEGYVYVGNSSGQAAGVAKNTVPVSDFGAAAADLSLGNGTTNHKIINLADPTTDQEAATKKYVDSKTSSTQTGTTMPSAPKTGDSFYSTTDNRLYVYNGTTWVPVDNALPNGQLYVGNASGVAAATAKNTISLSGFGAAVADIALGNGTVNYKITNLADPTADQEAATKKYVDSKSGSAPTGGTMPSNPKAGDNFYSTTDNRLYVYNGTSWVPVDNALPYGQLYLGNASGVAVAAPKTSIPLSGFGAAEANISLGTNRITDLATPVGAADAASKSYVDEQVAAGGADNLGNHSASANIKMGTYLISKDGGLNEGLSFDDAGSASFAQNVTINGNLYTPSDLRLKIHIETLGSVLQQIDKIRGVRFEYKDQKKYAAGQKIGIIAQELQKVYPEMVMKGEDGFLKVDYTQLTGALIQAIREQQQQMRQQQLEINELKLRLEKQQQQIDAILLKIK